MSTRYPNMGESRGYTPIYRQRLSLKRLLRGFGVKVQTGHTYPVFVLVRMGSSFDAHGLGAMVPFTPAHG